ncbi:MAG: glutamate-5-semialdehyde dehydrogenase [Planctomycetota bacterium]|nr:glutamate-5-semialdehyde dehydrogenase [Planctomycetota bacterium]
MANTGQFNLEDYCVRLAESAKKASAELRNLSGETKNSWLLRSAAELRQAVGAIMTANAKDLDRAPQFGLTTAQIDRLRLDEKRIEQIAAGLEEIAGLPDPIGEVLDSSRRPNGLDVSRVRVPLGVVFFVYESRPNVTADAAAICLKSGNAVILRGGKEAYYSSRAIVDVLLSVGKDVGVPEYAVQLVDIADREAVGHFLQLDSFIDVAIPRGGESLIRRVAEQAKMPVIKHYTGNCHVYVDATAELEMAVNILVNSKCQRPGVCNACETLLIHADVAGDYLPALGQALQNEQVLLRACENSAPHLEGSESATEDDFGTEYLDLILAVKVVENTDAAIEHINQYGSGHTDAIVTSDLRTARHFVNQIDSSAVMVNSSTRFNDGSQLGLGAEIGISTDKLHARGPCGLRELTTYKYVCFGDGLIREG